MHARPDVTGETDRCRQRNLDAVRVHEPEHVFAHVDELAHRGEACRDVARERRTNLGTSEIGLRAFQGGLRVGQRVLRLVALRARFVEQGLRCAVLCREFVGALELPLPAVELGFQPREVGSRPLDLDLDDSRIDTRDKVAGSHVGTDFREPGQHAFDLAGNARVVKAHDGTGHVDAGRHLAHFRSCHFDACRRECKFAVLARRRPGGAEREQDQGAALDNSVNGAGSQGVALPHVISRPPPRPLPIELGARAASAATGSAAGAG